MCTKEKKIKALQSFLLLHGFENKTTNQQEKTNILCYKLFKEEDGVRYKIEVLAVMIATDSRNWAFNPTKYSSLLNNTATSLHPLELRIAERHIPFPPPLRFYKIEPLMTAVLRELKSHAY